MRIETEENYVLIYQVNKYTTSVKVILMYFYSFLCEYVKALAR